MLIEKLQTQGPQSAVRLKVLSTDFVQDSPLQASANSEPRIWVHRAVLLATLGEYLMLKRQS
jgi:hypothetical protein